MFFERALSSIREVMEIDGQMLSYRKFITPASGTVSFAKALNRIVTGSMNELIKFAELWLADSDISPHDVGHKLNDILLSALATENSHGYGKPNVTFKAMPALHTASERNEE